MKKDDKTAFNRITKYEELILASTKSTRVSLAGVRIGRYSLSEHRHNLLMRVPNPGDYVKVGVNSLELMDLAFLSAKTGHEFAILRGKHEDVLFHGTSTECKLKGELYDGLISHKYELVGHSHPGEEEPTPSMIDREALKEIGQKMSTVISARTGRTVDYTEDPFE